MPILDDKNVKSDVSNLIIENREKVSVSGVEDVESYNDASLIIHTSVGILSVKGADLHITKYNVDTGELMIEGEVDEAVYMDNNVRQKGGLFSKMFG